MTKNHQDNPSEQSFADATNDFLSKYQDVSEGYLEALFKLDGSWIESAKPGKVLSEVKHASWPVASVGWKVSIGRTE